jgi:hypothetical protein
MSVNVVEQEMLGSFVLGTAGIQQLVKCNATMCTHNQEESCAAEDVHVVVTDDDVPACNVFAWDKNKWVEMTREDMYEAAAMDFVRAAQRLMKLTGAYSMYADTQAPIAGFSAHVTPKQFYKLPGKPQVVGFGLSNYPAKICRFIGGVEFFRLLDPKEIQDYLPWSEL